MGGEPVVCKVSKDPDEDGSQREAEEVVPLSVGEFQQAHSSQVLNTDLRDAVLGPRRYVGDAVDEGQATFGHV